MAVTIVWPLLLLLRLTPGFFVFVRVFFEIGICGVIGFGMMDLVAKSKGRDAKLR
jgi:hypothetical protein